MVPLQTFDAYTRRRNENITPVGVQSRDSGNLNAAPQCEMMLRVQAKPVECSLSGGASSHPRKLYTREYKSLYPSL